MSETGNTLVASDLAELATMHQPPCLSLYQPTHRHHPDNQQDPIRFRNLVEEMRASLSQKYPAGETASLLEPFDALGRDHAFWNHAMDGLAVFGGPSFFRVFRVQRPVVELVVVADTFHTKPLRRLLQSTDRYQILGLSLAKIRLFEGNRDALDEIDLAPGVPRTITEALGDELTEPHLAGTSYGGPGGAGPGAVSYHGHGGRKDESEIDAERFFRAVDRAVLEHHSRPSGLPLMVAALTKNHHLFLEISRNPFLMAEGPLINPDAIPIEELRRVAWAVVEPQYLARLAARSEEFTLARSRGLGSSDLREVAEAAAAGRVATVLIESGRQIPGRLDGSTGRIEPADLNHPHVDDLLDDMAELVERMGGEVLVIPAERMPSDTGLAATFRY